MSFNKVFSALKELYDARRKLDKGMIEIESLIFISSKIISEH